MISYHDSGARKRGEGFHAAEGTSEDVRLAEDSTRTKNWKRWGPYVSERQWGTCREDYSADGNSWGYFSHDQARSRAYRWGEDGILGVTDRECRLCFALCMWNGRDSILKERLFGLTGPEGNHGEDVKEQYFYIDSTPTHSYMKGLYKYPQRRFPYEQLVKENAERGRSRDEFELSDTDAFADGRYFDVQAEYAKNSPNDLLIRLTVTNHADHAAPFHFLPTLWYRNTWVWGCKHEGCTMKPLIKVDPTNPGRLIGEHETLKRFYFEAETLQSTSTGASVDTSPPEWLFTDNHTNVARLWGGSNDTPYVKDSFHDYVVHGKQEAVNPRLRGTKVAAYHRWLVPAKSSVTLRLRLYSDEEMPAESFGSSFERVFAQRIAEADEFYGTRMPKTLTPEENNVCRQAFAGLLWSKQFYHLIVKDWIAGDPDMPAPPAERTTGRNSDWKHLFNRDIISMPDKWEYPWYAAWDLAFHCVTLAAVDVQFAKDQLLLILREWYMHPNGALPAYEFAFGDVNPPVHAWACWQVYKLSGAHGGRDCARDRLWLARVFQKLVMNFTWWVNRKDATGHHIFSGGFLGLDNIGVFDRSKPLPTGGHLEQADGTAWMAFYALFMLKIAMELAQDDPAYEDVASKFFEHFVAIADAMNSIGGTGLWDEETGFYNDQLHVPGRPNIPLRIRSLVGVVPFFAIANLPSEQMNKLPGFAKRTQWFLKNRPDLAKQISFLELSDQQPAEDPHIVYHLAVPNKDRVIRVLQYLFDEQEFLSQFGIRSLSKFHEAHPFEVDLGGERYCVDYSPAESRTALFGGNSNWRGPIWFPMNILLVEAMERLYHFYGDSLTIDFPTGSGNKVNLLEASKLLASRLVSLFMPGSNGRRPCHADDPLFAKDPAWSNLPLFYEYFHGDSGKGLGASHQTGWTACVATLLIFIGSHRR
eukprot:TRINITY_DN5719_c0_g1_i4.p1 TRINITY_DN5719_c0_g1~~TRINITY_DN5719_c0_g1_i4.p1  ORF type:complete len:927 (-),score=269.62 TRINITY_DN5719_c0_g1_i4:177-2957(-)